jgi:hypothetical protein
MLNLLLRRANACLQFSLMEHSGKDVAQVGAQLLELWTSIGSWHLL